MLKHLNKCNNVCGKNVSLTPDFIEKFFFTNFKTEKL